jgi:copper chaperone CopZ
MNVLVFKTNMVCDGCKHTVGNVLAQLDNTLRWTVDLEDHEKILRIETAYLTPTAVRMALHKAGFTCEELV